MSTQPPVNAAGTTATMVGPKTTPNKQSSKMHRRSRSGCFTCRLRRKKCDEGKPSCKACKHLGLKCEYKRPMWWGNNEQRRSQKENIKTIIRHTKLSEKTTQAGHMGGESPPELSFSLPTSDTFSDAMDRTRSVSVDSHFSFGYDFAHAPAMPVYHAFDASADSMAGPPLYGPYPPYEIDVKTERQTFVNDVPTRRDSSISTFSTFQPPPPTSHSTLSSYPLDPWPPADSYDLHDTPPFRKEEAFDFSVFDYAHAHPTTSHQALIQVDECDQRLLNHFIDNVLRLIFPVLELNQHGSTRSDVILPALETNKCYLHCCLSISALHLKATQGLSGEEIDGDIMRHRYATISELCEALNRDTDHAQILEATLGMIFLQCSVSGPDDSLPDIPWHQHFQAATSLVHKLDLHRQPVELDQIGQQRSPFNMTLTSWIDILGATMLRRAPQFADTYREKHLSMTSLGLSELMGCDDRVMYLISEIACLEALKLDGMDEIRLCDHIRALGEQIDQTEFGSDAIGYPYSSTGAIRPRQLSRNMTALFRLAARIYLCRLVPSFDRNQASITALVDKFADCLEYIPSGPQGFDKSLVWPLLVGGSVAMPGSSFRRVFQQRLDRMGDHADFGGFGRMVCLLQEVWRQADEQGQHVHWRDVMLQQDWDFLLI
ncbi:MAG: hypothetical protein M1817_003579 [Caeruleum heppii]|nr:MAG: hypothetical protein M1817_003579 [Caeruleum heppii]